MALDVVPIKSTISFHLTELVVNDQVVDLTQSGVQVSLLLRNEKDETEYELAATITSGEAVVDVPVTRFLAAGKWLRRWRYQRVADSIDVRSPTWTKFYVE